MREKTSWKWKQKISVCMLALLLGFSLAHAFEQEKKVKEKGRFLASPPSFEIRPLPFWQDPHFFRNPSLLKKEKSPPPLWQQEEGPPFSVHKSAIPRFR